MIHPKGSLELGEVATMPAARRTNRKVSRYGIHRGLAFKCPTVEGVTFITRLGESK
jgi:hypothetical protein